MEINYISNLQKETLLIVDNLINQNKDFMEIVYELLERGYNLRAVKKNNYISKNKMKIFKNDENSFVTLIKRKNGLATWETTNLK